MRASPADYRAQGQPVNEPVIYLGPPRKPSPVYQVPPGLAVTRLTNGAAGAADGVLNLFNAPLSKRPRDPAPAGPFTLAAAAGLRGPRSGSANWRIVAWLFAHPGAWQTDLIACDVGVAIRMLHRAAKDFPQLIGIATRPGDVLPPGEAAGGRFRSLLWHRAHDEAARPALAALRRAGPAYRP